MLTVRGGIEKENEAVSSERLESIRPGKAM